MMAMSSWANGRNTSEKNCASHDVWWASGRNPRKKKCGSHDESWSKKCNKADSASLTAIPRSDAFLPTGATRRHHEWRASHPDRTLAAFFIEASSLPLAARQLPVFIV